MTIRQIRRIVRGKTPGEIRRELNELREEYDREERSFRLVEIENGYQILTEVEFFPFIRKLRNDIRTVRLSRAALETLAIVAYKQPVTRAEIEQIRGVDAGGVLRTLLDRGLATIRGRGEGVGHPLLYGTSDFFLNHFGLRDLDELPRIEELSELMRSREMDEVRAEVEERLGPEEKDDPDDGITKDGCAVEPADTSGGPEEDGCPAGEEISPDADEGLESIAGGNESSLG